MTGARTQHGYTLVEMLVTVTIFALAFTAIAAIFLGFTTAQSRANSAQKLLNEGNFIFEAVAREVRMNTIEYVCPGVSYATQHDAICLRSVDDGKTIRFKYEAGTTSISVCMESGPSPCVDSTDWRVLNPSYIKVNKFEWYVFPTEDPLKTTDTRQMFHPIVTLKMTIETGKAKARQVYDFQTAVTSRSYAL